MPQRVLFARARNAVLYKGWRYYAMYETFNRASKDLQDAREPMRPTVVIHGLPAIRISSLVESQPQELFARAPAVAMSAGPKSKPRALAATRKRCETGGRERDREFRFAVGRQLE